MVCTNCGHIGYAKNAVKGSLALEVILWLFFIIPGLVYSLWRSTSSARYLACSVCGQKTLVPANSPVGKKLLEEQGKTIEGIQTEEKQNKAAVNKSTLKTIKIVAMIGGFFILLSIIEAIFMK